MNSLELAHHGVKGQRWGIIRNLRNKSGKKKSTQDVPLTAEQISSKKEKIAKSRSAALIYKNADLFSDEELVGLKKRLQLEKDVKDLIPPVEKGKSKVDTMISAGQKASDFIDTGSKLYNSIARVHNAANKDDQWPLINTGKEGKKAKASGGNSMSDMASKIKSATASKDGPTIKKEVGNDIKKGVNDLKKSYDYSKDIRGNANPNIFKEAYRQGQNDMKKKVKPMFDTMKNGYDYMKNKADQNQKAANMYKQKSDMYESVIKEAVNRATTKRTQNNGEVYAKNYADYNPYELPGSTPLLTKKDN